ncbi:hypothetical protein [Halocola ammonii]
MQTYLLNNNELNKQQTLLHKETCHFSNSCTALKKTKPMFDIFKRKSKELPPFNELENSELKDKFFMRLLQWDWIDRDTIHVIDNNAPRMITMDPWPQLVYLGATGQQTITEFVYEMAGKYGKSQTIPENLDLTVLDTIDRLLNENLVRLSNERKALPYYINLPRSKQDKEKAEKLMIIDNYIKK